MLAIEIDGDQWHSEEWQVKRDIRRDEYLRTQGYQVVRINSKYVFSYVGYFENMMLELKKYFD